MMMRISIIAASLLLGGCATLSSDGASNEVSQAVRQSIGQLGVSNAQVPNITDAVGPETERAIKGLLAQQPMSMETAVRLALLNSPAVRMHLAQLRISEAERVQAITLPNPHFSFMRAVEGDKVMLERAIGFNIMSLITLPWRSQWQNQQYEMARLETSQNIIRIAADARKAWINAVAAEQSAQYAAQASTAAQAAGELARRMAQVGNWSRLNQAKEQSVLADTLAAQARAENTAFSEREKLIRVLGLWGPQAQFKLPDRLPELPTSLLDSKTIEAQALAQRLDVRAAAAQAEAVGRSLGFVRSTGLINALDWKGFRETTTDQNTFDKERKRGWELELPIPIFDWGGAANARAQASYAQALAKIQMTAVTARSEAREAWHSYRTAHDLARHYRDEIVPLRQFINDQTLLQYNGMLVGVFDLINDTRTNIAAVRACIDAYRDFWLIETDLQVALSGTSPGGMAGLSGATSASTSTEAKGH